MNVLFVRKKGHWKAHCPKLLNSGRIFFKTPLSHVVAAAPSTVAPPGYGICHVYPYETTSQVSDLYLIFIIFLTSLWVLLLLVNYVILIIQLFFLPHLVMCRIYNPGGRLGQAVDKGELYIFDELKVPDIIALTSIDDLSSFHLNSSSSSFYLWHS